jgi:hypothetical protein
MTIARQQLGNWVFQLSGFCELLLTANHGRKLFSLYNSGSDHRETTTTNSSSVVSLLFLCLCACMCTLPVTARQQLGKHVPTVMNTQATTEELLYIIFYVVHVISKESTRLLLLRTSCFIFYKDLLLNKFYKYSG